MKTFECTECGAEIQAKVKPVKPCSCGAHGKWKEVAGRKVHSLKIALGFFGFIAASLTVMICFVTIATLMGLH